MDYSDRKIIENQLAGPVSKMVLQWLKANGVGSPVRVNASVMYPTCYADEQGLTHNGPLVICDVMIYDEDDFLDDDDDDDD